MDERRCKNCSYWAAETEISKLIDQEKSGYCICPKIVYDQFRDLSEPEADGALYHDGESYYACFITGPLFGCVQFKKKVEEC